MFVVFSVTQIAHNLLTMKKLLFILACILLTLTSCDPPKDDLCYEYVTGERYEVECD